MFNKQALDNFKSIFDKFANKYDTKKASALAIETGQDLVKSFKTIALMAIAMKRAVIVKVVEDKIPANKVEQFVNDLYDVITGPDTAAAIYDIIHTQDFSAIDKMLENKLQKVQGPVDTTAIALTVSTAIRKGLADYIGQQMMAQTNKMPLLKAPHIDALNKKINETTDMINTAKDADLDKISEMIMSTSNSAPSETLEKLYDNLVAGLNRDVIQGILDDGRAKIPAPKSLT